jgi:hypothetical protein
VDPKSGKKSFFDIFVGRFGFSMIKSSKIALVPCENTNISGSWEVY